MTQPIRTQNRLNMITSPICKSLERFEKFLQKLQGPNKSDIKINLIYNFDSTFNNFEDLKSPNFESEYEDDGELSLSVDDKESNYEEQLLLEIYEGKFTVTLCNRTFSDTCYFETEIDKLLEEIKKSSPTLAKALGH